MLNQYILNVRYSVLIGHFSSTSTNIVRKVSWPYKVWTSFPINSAIWLDDFWSMSFMTMNPELGYYLNLHKTNSWYQISIAGERKRFPRLTVNQYSYQNLGLYLNRQDGRVVDGFTTTCAISAYHHWCCEFESRSGWGVQHYVIKFVSDLRQVGGCLQVFRFHPLKKLTATIQLKYCWKWH